MSRPQLSSEAKQALATTIRSLRDRMLRDIRDEAERQYRLSIPLARAGLDEAHQERRRRLDGWLNEGVRASRAKTGRADCVLVEQGVFGAVCGGAEVGRAIPREGRAFIWQQRSVREETLGPEPCCTGMGPVRPGS